MRIQIVLLMIVLVVVTAITSFNVTASVVRMQQTSSVISPTRAMLEAILEVQKAGHHERATRMMERLHRGYKEYGGKGQGRAPEQFYHEVLGTE